MKLGGNHVDELISASLTGDLTDAERVDLDAHLVRCETCRNTLAAFTAKGCTSGASCTRSSACSSSILSLYAINTVCTRVTTVSSSKYCDSTFTAIGTTAALCASKYSYPAVGAFCIRTAINRNTSLRTGGNFSLYFTFFILIRTLLFCFRILCIKEGQRD